MSGGTLMTVANWPMLTLAMRGRNSAATIVTKSADSLRLTFTTMPCPQLCFIPMR